jgi:hypothetical protein
VQIVDMSSDEPVVMSQAYVKCAEGDHGAVKFHIGEQVIWMRAENPVMRVSLPFSYDLTKIPE